VLALKYRKSPFGLRAAMCHQLSLCAILFDAIILTVAINQGKQ
jgi:hypothetical protein